MSDNTADEQQQTSAIAALGRLVEFDPRELELDPRNAREENVKPDRALLASVERIGVQEPISVRPLGKDEQGKGRFGVFKGQRRWLAALAAAKKAETKGKPVRRVPAFVRDDLEGVDGEALLLSLVENTHRARMTTRDQVNGAAQLELIGTSEAERRRAAEILGLKRADLKAAKQASELTPEGLKEGASYAFDLMELADLQAVESVHRAAYRLHVAKVEDARDPKKRRGAWQHTVAELRQEKLSEEKRQAAAQALTEAGVKVLPPYRSMDATDRRLSDLTNGLGKKITTSVHAQCSGHAARVDEDGEPVFYCTDPQRYGHKIKGVPDAAEAGAAAKAQRAKVIKNNKAARAAREVRQEFITGMVRKPLSEAAWALLLSTILHNPEHHRRFVNKTHEKAAVPVARFTKAADPTGKAEPFADLIKRTGKARRPNLLLAHVAASYEADMADSAWDRPTSTNQEWLTFLDAEGYPLSDHEAAMLAGPETGTTDDARCGADETAPDELPADEAPERQETDDSAAPEESGEEGPGAEPGMDTEAEAEDPAAKPQEAADEPEQAPGKQQAEESTAAPEESAQQE